MDVERAEDALEICLQRFEDGGDLDEVLAHYPSQAAELRVLLAVAQNTRGLAQDILVPAAAQSGSRTRFLTAAAELKPVRQGFKFTLSHLRLATSSLIIIGILAFVLLGTGIASANSLPGDVFYPVKLMVEQIHMNLVQDPPARLELEQTYDDRRMSEVEKLNQLKRREDVNFSGLLERTGDDLWMVGDIRLSFPVDSPLPVDLVGAYVQVEGYVLDQTVEVKSIQPRRLQWSGNLQKLDSQSWQVGGITVLINSETKISGTPQVGALVEVGAIRLAQDRFIALTLQVAPAEYVSKSTSTSSPTARLVQRTSTPVPGDLPGDDLNGTRPSSTSGLVIQPTGTNPRPEETKTPVRRTEVEKTEQDRKRPSATRASTGISKTPVLRTPAPTTSEAPEHKSTETRTAGSITPAPTND